MQIKADNISKKFGKQSILENFSKVFSSGKSYAVTGANGSGKSTLLKLLSGYISPTRGTINYFDNEKLIDRQDQTEYITYCAPYLDLIDYFTLEELLIFHSKFRKIIVPVKNILTIFNFPSEKLIKDYSSGMKQRVRLLLSFYTDSEVLFLDEPTSNLDRVGIDWYKKKVKQLKTGKVVIIASNNTEEYDFCDEIVSLENY